MSEVPPEFYDEKYFEGSQKTKSNYEAYHLSEGIFRVAAYMIATMFRCKLSLDVGCAYGFLTKYLRHGMHVGIDVSKYAIAQRRVTNRLLLASATDLPFRDNTFELVTSFETTEHLSEENILKMYQEIERVGKKWVFITSPHPDNHPEEDPTDYDKSHISKKPEEDWIKHGTDLGWYYDTKKVQQAKAFQIVQSYQWQVMVFDLSKRNL